MFNFYEVMSSIKSSIFIGDHGAVYSMARSIAFICACLSLIVWYNKFMNDPFGKLDIRAIVRTGIVLFLVCNFYSYVVIPLDSMTSMVAKGLTATVDHDRAGLKGKLNHLYEEVEDAVNKRSMAGMFENEMSGYMEDTSLDEGLSYGSSPVLESEAEVSVNKGEKKGFFRKIWGTIKGAASEAMNINFKFWANVLSWIISIVVAIVRYILIAVSGVYLIILALVGPFAFALSIIPAFRGNIASWVARYIQISFWMPMTAFVDFVNFRIKDIMVDMFINSSLIDKMLMPNLHLIVLDLVTLVCLLAIPSMCGWMISSAGASDVNGAIVSTAKKAASMMK